MTYVKEKGFADSKTLTEAKRQELLKAIKARARASLLSVSLGSSCKPDGPG